MATPSQFYLPSLISTVKSLSSWSAVGTVVPPTLCQPPAFHPKSLTRRTWRRWRIRTRSCRICGAKSHWQKNHRHRISGEHSLWSLAHLETSSCLWARCKYLKDSWEMKRSVKSQLIEVQCSKWTRCASHLKKSHRSHTIDDAVQSINHYSLFSLENKYFNQFNNFK